MADATTAAPKARKRTPRPIVSAPDHALLFDRRSFAKYMETSPRNLDREVALGRLPRRDFSIGNSPRWRFSTILKWMEDKAAASARRAEG